MYNVVMILHSYRQYMYNVPMILHSYRPCMNNVLVILHSYRPCMNNVLVILHSYRPCMNNVLVILHSLDRVQLVASAAGHFIQPIEQQLFRNWLKIKGVFCCCHGAVYESRNLFTRTGLPEMNSVFWNSHTGWKPADTVHSDQQLNSFPVLGANQSKTLLLWLAIPLLFPFELQ